MKKLSKIVLSLSILAAIPTLSFAEVIEIATFNLKEGVTYQQFAPLDKAVEVEHVTKQAGFLSRETAKGTDGEWLVIVHWDTLQNADASMNSFMNAKAASQFMAHVDASTMKMKRYTK
ncbi:hypothetical protein [Shewanella frigidimarina]|uniref:ABM domain-containing protein n=1 Tax=Shewanella frigidimarina TaxID=56812 RepID=A0A106BYZ0_SHEFR|nr:hypothetical protein [Shewanella frigidimarina]KVX01184.1 hypothetical protein AWJ07_06955 [Shewanella frigidimarina]